MSNKDQKQPGPLFAMFMGCGVAIGAGLGVAMGNIALGAGLGVAIGAALGLTVGAGKKGDPPAGES